MIGQEQRFHPEYSSPEKLYIALFGVPIIGLRIRARNVLNLLPKHLSPARILDAGSGAGGNQLPAQPALSRSQRAWH